MQCDEKDDGGTYEEWALDYCRRLGVSSVSIGEAIMSWGPALLGGLRLTIADLQHATNAIIAGQGKTPQWPADHLDAIKAAAIQASQARIAAESQRETMSGHSSGGLGVCNYCGETGLVLVPHPNWIRDGEWVPYTRSGIGRPLYHHTHVYCRCRRGERCHTSAVDRKTNNGTPDPLCTLSRYETAYNAAWMEHMQERDRDEAALQDAIFTAGDGEVAKGQVMSVFRSPRS